MSGSWPRCTSDNGRQQAGRSCASGWPSNIRWHTLAHVARWQGWRTRYRSQRKDLFDLRRCDVVDILDVLSHLPMHAEKAA